MSEILTPERYEQSKEKLRDLESRLAIIEKRTDLAPAEKKKGRARFSLLAADNPGSRDRPASRRR
jgi:hypothetical protein